MIYSKYYFNLTPTIALTALIHSYYSGVAKTILPTAFTYPILVKADRFTTILPSEEFHILIFNINYNDLVEIKPVGFITNYIKEIDKDIVLIQNSTDKPTAIKKNTSLCQIKKIIIVSEKNLGKTIKGRS